MTNTTLKTILFAIVAAMANGAAFGQKPVVPPTYPKANVKVLEINERSKNINRFGDLSQSVNHEKEVNAYRNRLREAERYSKNVNHKGDVSISRNVDKSIKNDINKYSYHDSDSYNADSDELSVSRNINEHIQTRNRELKHNYEISDNLNSAGSISFSENERREQQFYGHSRTLKLSKESKPHYKNSNSYSKTKSSQQTYDSYNKSTRTYQTNQSDSYTKTRSQNYSKKSHNSHKSDKSAPKHHKKY